MSSQNTSGAIFDGDSVSVGDLVFDRDTDHADPAVVVNIPPKPADEWIAYSDTTVAEDNPEYPADASIVVVAFRNEILDEQPEMVTPDSPIPLQDLNDIGIHHYSFPAPRLRRADPETDDFEALEDLDIPTDNTDDIDDTDGTNGTNSTENTESKSTAASEDEQGEPEDTTEDQEQKLEELREFLRDNGVRSEIDADDGVVVAEKLGESYEIALDGEVNGGGAFQDRLEQLASEYTA